MTNVISLNSDFSSGYDCAKEEVASGNIYCVESALMSFDLDPPDSEFQRGFRHALMGIVNRSWYDSVGKERYLKIAYADKSVGRSGFKMGEFK